jgi:4-amino-4-deoxy-L-arabinose transferase-like glycosyltransferase
MRHRTERRALHAFLVLWALVLIAKLVLAARLPLFVDEAFYWQEGRHLAWAYSDLPGLTAWLTRLGTELFGHGTLGLRVPFLLVAAAIPWLVASVTAREFGRHAGWTAATFALLLPLSGTLGLLAVPDAAMVLAALLCVDAVARLLRTVTAGASVELALGLAIGALSHYRFIAVIGVGFLVLLYLAEGRRLLRDPRVLIALALGAVAWAPLIAWNLENAEAGLRFQLVDRHPWSFHADGAWFVAIQLLLVTPLLLCALAVGAWRHRASPAAPRRLFALTGAWIVLGVFVLGFFADTERVSFHWPLPGFVLLLPLLPGVLAAWTAPWRRATYALAAVGLLAMLGYYAAVSVPALRERTAAEKWYPGNFAGWERLARAVRDARADMPGNTWIVADNFKIGAELGFALQDPTIQVLDHPLNRKHGRAPQLELWGLHSDGRADWGETPVLLVVGASEVPYRELLARYHWLCARVGPLPAPRVVNVDHGRQRFLLFALPAAPAAAGAPCTAPAMAWFDAPVSGAAVRGTLPVAGWAFKDGVGLSRVEVLVDGRPAAEARYGLPSPGTAAYWKISTDPNHPDVGFSANLDTSGLAPGRHWLGLRLHGRDGSVEDWSEQPFEVLR